ncbi:MAG: hypothetical protein R3C02_18725 [Planctomycetaceae bacterium]|nr:hypothetical protein [Planctomycetaceae bacterium]
MPVGFWSNNQTSIAIRENGVGWLQSGQGMYGAFWMPQPDNALLCAGHWIEYNGPGSQLNNTTGSVFVRAKSNIEQSGIDYLVARHFSDGTLGGGIAGNLRAVDPFTFAQPVNLSSGGYEVKTAESCGPLVKGDLIAIPRTDQNYALGNFWRNKPNDVIWFSGLHTDRVPNEDHSVGRMLSCTGVFAAIDANVGGYFDLCFDGYVEGPQSVISGGGEELKTKPTFEIAHGVLRFTDAAGNSMRQGFTLSGNIG